MEPNTNTDTQRLTRIVSEAIRNVLFNTTPVCNAPPDIQRQHTEFIAEQRQINRHILEGIEELKAANAKQLATSIVVSDRLLTIETTNKTLRDNWARNGSVVAILIAAAGTIFQWLKN